MVKYEDITSKRQTLHKVARVGGLARKVFGSKTREIMDILLISNIGIPVFRELFGRTVISVIPSGDRITLFDEKYFDKAQQFAKDYEEAFGVQVTLQTDYSGPRG